MEDSTETIVEAGIELREPEAEIKAQTSLTTTSLKM